MEQLYEVLCYCHGLTQHGGRDKTCAAVREHYSWVPKELVAQFVKGCPTCLMKRAGNLEPVGTTERAIGLMPKEEQEERTSAANSAGGRFDSIGLSTAGLTESSRLSILKASILRRPNDENVLPTEPRPRGSNPFLSLSQVKVADRTQKNNAGLLATNNPLPCSFYAPQPPPTVVRPVDTLRYYGNLISGNNIWNSAGLPPLREGFAGQCDS
ncbi:hypothetical protein EDC04DRAFT_1200348 [Pisolithus marmoratus]|nr:hypothetical protein EDC04DRAFT_1200348 [Pisolithus marmoratus]